MMQGMIRIIKKGFFMNHIARYALLCVYTSAHALGPSRPPFEAIRNGHVAVPSVSGFLVPFMLIQAILNDQKRHNGSYTHQQPYTPQKPYFDNKKFPKQKNRRVN